MTNARALGINHVAIEVGDVDEALDFYERFFSFELRSRFRNMAFIDLGDQFLALARSEAIGEQSPERHFGLVVDDREAVRERVREAGQDAGKAGGSLRIRDPWGNTVEIVAYAEIQFSKTPGVLRGMGVEAPEKTESALAELREKGMA